MKILDKVNSPEDIKKLSTEELKQLPDEIRDFIIEKINETGGHLGSSLGVVELTVALHKVFNTPKDKIVWDVGHQGYPHKIITGRKDRFHTNRTLGGISGFIKPSESEHDAFGVGHASTSISAGLGYVLARELSGDDYNVISVIGDGSITGGLAYEGLNNAGWHKKKFVVILNDNEMSISKNVGAISNYLTSVFTHPFFNKVKNDLWNFTGKFDFGKTIREAVSKFDSSVKALVTPGVFFEKLGFNYIGPINGHNIENLITVLDDIKKNVSGPVLLHVVTEKGKGFKPAEEDKSQKLHGVGPGVLDKPVKKSPSKEKYQDVFGKALVNFAKDNDKLLAITAAMTSGTGLDEFAKEYPDRFFDVGIAEGHAVTCAASMSMSGYKPVVAIYSTFIQRAYDNVIHDCALQNTDMILALDRAGLVGEDGPTHHGVFDLSFLRNIPNITIMAPKNGSELVKMLYTASVEKGLFAVRYPRGNVTDDCVNYTPAKIEIGKGEVLREGKTVALVAIGKGVEYALSAADLLANEDISCGVFNMRFVKPLDTDMIKDIASKYDYVVTVEENTVVGGFGTGVMEFLNEENICTKILRIGIPDKFIEHGDVSKLHSIIGLDGQGIAEKVKNFIRS